MTAAVNTNTLASLGLTNQTEVNRTSGQVGQADFLMLMTQQLKNQDPLKPLDSQQFLGQLAQFSTVQGIEQMQNAMGAMASVMESDQTLRAASLVGHQALVEASLIEVPAGAGASGEIDATQAGAVTLEISDANGNLVRKITLQADKAGPLAWEWDGLDDAGNPVDGGRYTLKAAAGNAASGTGAGVAQTVAISAEVESVSIGLDGLTLNLAGVGSHSLYAVRRIG